MQISYLAFRAQPLVKPAWRRKECAVVSHPTLFCRSSAWWALRGKRVAVLRPRLEGVLGGSSKQSPQNPTPPPTPNPSQQQPCSPHRNPCQPCHQRLRGTGALSPPAGLQPGAPDQTGSEGSRQVGVQLQLRVLAGSYLPAPCWLTSI